MRRVIIATLVMLVLFLISFSNFSEAITVSIKCDSWGKITYPGESVFFNLTIINHDEVYTCDLHLSSEPETLFNITDFTLHPGEEQSVNQTVTTSKSDPNGTIHNISVHVEGVYYLIQPIPGSTNDIHVWTEISVLIINNSNVTEEDEHIEFKNSNNDVGIIYAIILLILTVAVIIIFFVKKKKLS
jgi:hypothetical protein